ncbi:MAG: SusC/RagA family TonB-linked outer membrane protein [Chitinophagaceae bacterium]|nr:SusC/RagA family TonB-linked outer membrane protein [Chitinophagaceae bacterium]
MQKTPRIPYGISTKTLLIMNFAVILLLAAFLQVSGMGFSQKVTLSEKSETLIKVFQKIKKQTGYGFFFDESWLQLSARVTIRVKEVPIKTALDICFRDQPLTYSIVGNTVVVELKPQNEAYRETVRAPLPIDVRGRVTDEEGNPLSGASVKLKGMETGTATDANGNFTLQIPDKGVVLVVSFVGYQTQEITVRDQLSLTIQMELSDKNKLDDIVVTGYTSKRLAEISSSVSVVSGESLNDVTSSDVTSLLQGKAPGIVVSKGSGNPNAKANIIIRGSSSISAGSYPLYVVDGIIGGEADPMDIESITILKDAAATGLYGSRAANGVVIITTKSGKAGKNKINFNSTVGFNAADMGNFRLMNGRELYEFQKSFYPPQLFEIDRPQSLLNTDTDWWDIFYRRGLTQRYGLSVSGGSEKTKVYVSGNYYNEEGTLRHTERKTYNLRFNIIHNISRKFKLNAKFNGSFTDSENDASGGYGANIGATGNIPWDNPYNPDGSIKIGSEPGWVGREYRSYIYDWQYNFDYAKGNAVDVDLNLDYTILPNLVFTTANRISFNNRKRELYYDVRSKSGNGIGILQNWINSRRNLISSNRLRYNIDLGVHSISAIAVLEGETNVFDGNTLLGNNIPAGLHVMDAAAYVGRSEATMTGGDGPGNKEENAFGKGLVQIDYNYDNRYFIVGSYVNESSSRFGANHRSGNFFTLGGSWIISNEKFMSKMTHLNQLKLRASYGEIGNANIGNYQSLGLYSYADQYANNPASYPFQLGNPDLTWEKTGSVNLGLDLVLWNRIYFGFDWYDKTSNALLLEVNKAFTSGYSSIISNVGSVKNRGIEINLTTKNFDGEAFKWETNFNIAFNKNRVLKLADGKDISSGNFRISEGRDLYSYYMRKFIGVDPDNGDPLWEKDEVDANGTVKVTPSNVYSTATLKFVGTASPDFTGGISNTFSYKGLYLTAFANFVSGILIPGYGYADGDAQTTNVRKLVKGETIWKNPGDIATYPKAIFGGNKQSTKTSSLLYGDGSYIRLRNITLGYELPGRLLQRLKLSNAKIYLSGDNLWTGSKFPGMNPEVIIADNGDDKGDYNIGSYPISKKVLFGISLGF